jgi:hypothetical protein
MPPGNGGGPHPIADPKLHGRMLIVVVGLVVLLRLLEAIANFRQELILVE